MGLKKILEGIDQILGKKKKARARKAAKLAELLGRLDKKRCRLEERIKGLPRGDERERAEGQLRATLKHLKRGRAELARLKSDG